MVFYKSCRKPSIDIFLINLIEVFGVLCCRLRFSKSDIISKLKNKEPLNIVADQIGTPTYAADLAAAIMKIISCYENGTAVYGIFHYSNDGVCTWFEFAKAIAEYSGLCGFADIKPCSSDEIIDNVKRPTYSVLSKKKIIKEYDVDVPYWRDSLKKCINKLSK